MLLGIRLTPFNLIGFVVLLATGAMLWIRYRRGVVTLSPLLYWAAVVAHARLFSGGYDLRLAVAGLLSTLLLRVEFLGARLRKVVRAIELALLGYVCWRTIGLLLMW